MKLTNIQQDQIEKQLKAHMHKTFHKDLTLDQNAILEDFEIHENVFRPDVTTAIFFARWLYFNNGIYKDKTLIEIGSGTGILGITCAIQGVKKAILSDISNYAVENTKRNAFKYNLKNIEIRKGNLFENISEKADIIIFNHPFFPVNPISEIPVSKSMLGGETLFAHFLEKAKEHLTENGIILTTYFDLAGKTNHPKFIGEKHGYIVSNPFILENNFGLQKGSIGVYVLKLKKEDKK